MINYKLLTPGPLTTSEMVKKEMMVDHCTWDSDYKVITQSIRKDLLEFAHVTEDEYTAVLMQGSGSFGVESVLISTLGENDKILIISNGAYGERIIKTVKQAKRNHAVYTCHYNEKPKADEVAKILAEDKSINHVVIVHCETTSGILNDIESIGRVVKEAGCTYFVDAMSSFGGVDIDMKALGIDFIVSSANKCIQGVPGFSFVICKKDALMKCEGKSTSISLDLYAQWAEMNKDGKWRFTSPTHVVLAFARAIEELKEEGGVSARERRYRENNKILIDGLTELGVSTYVDRIHQSPIITTFFYPENKKFNFEEMYNFVKERGYAIYPGKVTDADTFRIGNIGEIYPDDMEKLCKIFSEYFNK